MKKIKRLWIILVVSVLMVPSVFASTERPFKNVSPNRLPMAHLGEGADDEVNALAIQCKFAVVEKQIQEFQAEGAAATQGTAGSAAIQ
ncbi:hypothetical protein WDW37_12770 [Bdellovibrionota bacterium FG-1]